MAVEALCPTCGAVFNVKDELQGKKVRCSKCEQVFTVGGEKVKSREDKESVAPRGGDAAPKKRARDEEDDEDRVTPRKRAAAQRDRDDADDEDDRPRKGSSRRDRDEDDEDDDRPRAKKGKRVYHDDDDDDVGRKSKKLKEQVKRKGPRKSGSGGQTALIIVGAVCGVLLLVCGGVGYVVYAMYKGVENVAQQMQQDPNNIQVIGGPGVNPFLVMNIANLDDALAKLKSVQPGDKPAAASWLAQQNTFNAARQAEVARALEPLLTDADLNTRGTGMRALKVWADQNSVPAIVKALNEQTTEGIPGGVVKDGMATLGRLKDVRGAEAVARFLPNFFVKDDAAQALQQIGPGAEPAVLKYYHHKDGGAREKARALAQGYQTKESAIVAQSAADVKGAAERDTRREAARWLKTAKVDPQQQKAVAAALEAALNDTDNEVADSSMDALGTWASADSVPTLMKIVADGGNGGRQDNMRRKAMALLGKLKDPRAAAVVAARLKVSGDRKAASDALVAMGPGARPEVEKYATDPDLNVRREATDILNRLGGAGGNLGVAQALADLKSTDKNRQGDAARKLQTMAVDQAKRAEVAQALEAVAANATDRGVEEQAIRALAVWGSKDNGPALVKIISAPEQPGNCKNAAIDAMAKLKDDRVVKPLAAQLLVPNERSAATRQLIALGPDFGPAIESEVTAGLAAADKGLKVDCIKILGAVGTKGSIPNLQKTAQAALLLKQKDVATHCQEAIVAITARGR